MFLIGMQSHKTRHSQLAAALLTQASRACLVQWFLATFASILLGYVESRGIFAENEMYMWDQGLLGWMEESLVCINNKVNDASIIFNGTSNTNNDR